MKSETIKDKVKCAGCLSREYGVFKCVGSGTLDEVSQEKTFFQYQKKDVIFKEHDKITGFYCIKSGLVRTFRSSNNGKEQTFQIASRGKWLGFRDVISNGECNHTAVCLEDVEVCYISKETISKLIKSDEEFQIEVMKYLAEEWKETENHVYSLGTKQIHSRLAELLLTFYGAAGKLEPELNISVTREVMATCIGTTTETLIRALADFKDRNWIKVEKNKIELLNLKALYSLSESSVV